MPLTEIQTEEQLEELLSRPTPATIQAVQELDGELLILGVGGKMGPTLAQLARRSAQAAGVSLRVIGVARFSESGLREKLSAAGIETITCDLLDPRQRASLPPAASVLSMLGHKFSANEPAGKFWAINAYLVAALAEQYRDSRFVAFSTGNVYGFTPGGEPAPTEETLPEPVGEYAASAFARERLLDYFSRLYGTRMTILRLNYAVEARYGVLVDIGLKIQRGEPIDLSVPRLNCIWQGYANAVALQSFSLAESPARVLNLTGQETHHVRDLALGLAERLEMPVSFVEPEGTSSLLNDASRCRALYGSPEYGIEELLDLTAQWLSQGGRTLGRPTKFQARDGKF